MNIEPLLACIEGSGTGARFDMAFGTRRRAGDHAGSLLIPTGLGCDPHKSVQRRATERASVIGH